MDTILIQLLLSDIELYIGIHLRDDNKIFEKACISEREHLIKSIEFKGKNTKAK